MKPRQLLVGLLAWTLLLVINLSYNVAAAMAEVPLASAASVMTTYDAAGYAYATSAQLSTLHAAAATVRGTPAGPGAVSWRGHVAVARFGVAAETGAGVVESSVARTLTAAEQRSVASLQRQVAAHTEKLGAYRANPDAYDNLGFLERAPSPEIRQQIIDGRINHLETEMRGFQDQIDKILGGS